MANPRIQRQSKNPNCDARATGSRSGLGTTVMVRVIEKREDAGPDQSVLVFVVCRSRKDKRTVLGYSKPLGVVTDDQHQLLFTKTNCGVPVAEAFRAVVAIAERSNIPFVLVEDPDNLFPPDGRPIV
jgi:hypothetical protein